MKTDIQGHCTHCGTMTQGSAGYCPNCDGSIKGYTSEQMENFNLLTENARLKEENKQLLEKFKQLELSGNSGKLGWQSAETLPSEEGRYALQTWDRVGGDWILQEFADNLGMVLRSISFWQNCHYRPNEIEYFKLPE